MKAKLLLAILVLITTDCISQTDRTDTIITIISKKDTSIGNLILGLKGKISDDKLRVLSDFILYCINVGPCYSDTSNQIKKNTKSTSLSINEFCSLTDKSIFTEFAFYDTATITAPLKMKYKTLMTIHELDSLSSMPIDSVLVNIYKIRKLCEVINDPAVIKILKNLPDNPKDYARDVYSKADQYHADLIAVKKSANDSPDITYTKVELIELRKKYRKEIQKAYLNRLKVKG